MMVKLRSYCSIFVLISCVASSKAFSFEQEYLDWPSRPPQVLKAIEASFNRVATRKESSWGCYNGLDSYDHLNISQCKLAKKIIEDAHKEGRKDVYILDSGAGNFKSCDGFAKYLSNPQLNLPEGMTFHIIGTRGESYYGKEIEQIGPCKVYKFGSFKIEAHEEELKKRGLDLKDKIDLFISNWATRHYVDPLGTWIQFYHTIRPKTGFMIMDWCFYLYEEDTLGNLSNALSTSRLNLLDLLLYLNVPFLLEPSGNFFSKETDHFVIKRENDNPLKLPLAYKDIIQDAEQLGIASDCVTVFQVLDTAYITHKIKKSFFQSLNENDTKSSHSFWGDLNLFQWFEENNLMNSNFSNYFNQFFHVKEDKNEITPLYTEEEINKRKDKRQEDFEKKLAEFMNK